MGLVEAEISWSYTGIVGLVSLIPPITYSVVASNSHALIGSSHKRLNVC